MFGSKHVDCWGGSNMVGGGPKFGQDLVACKCLAGKGCSFDDMIQFHTILYGTCN